MFGISLLNQAGGLLLLVLVLLEKATAVDITGYVTSKRHEYGIFTQELDWFQAMSQCNEDGYQGLIVLPKMSSKVNLLMHVLRDNGYSSNSTFWTGLFRPFSYITNWYDSTTTPCQKFQKSTVNGDGICNHQCAALTFENMFDQITLRAENCSSSLPYICYKNVGPIKYDHIYDYSFTSIASYAKVDDHDNVNVTACEDICTEKGQCVGYTHSQTTDSCKIVYLDSGYGYMTYSVQPDVQKTHGYKTRLKPTFYPNTTFATQPVVNNTFPTCNVSEIPPGYCRCNISIQISNRTDNSVEELIQNLTLNKEETSKSRRRLTSADDTRLSAKAVGGVGLGIMIAFVLILFAFDFTVLLEQILTGFRLLKREMNIGIWKRDKED